MASKIQQQWPGRNPIALYVHCLHLLDLDLLPDWPNIDEQSICSKSNLQQRVRSVEWSLYRLLELYDSKETQDKLKPFFPPTIPLQSLNLRAALYRVLTDLKKNGLLGREVLLRKTMLDECKGERFEEVIAATAMIVLRKKVKPERTSISARSFPGSQSLPLILAYRRSIQRSLGARQALRKQVEQQFGKYDDLEQVLVNKEQDIKTTYAKENSDQNDNLSGLVHTNWLGCKEWADILLQGRPMQIESLPKVSLDSVLGGDSESEEFGKPNSVLDDLEERLKLYRLKLAEWKLILKDFGIDAPRDDLKTTSKSPQISTGPVFPSFAEHKTLNVNSYVIGSASLKPEVLPVYQQLLGSMKEELSAFPPKLNSTNFDGNPEFVTASNLSDVSVSVSKPASNCMLDDASMINDVAPTASPQNDYVVPTLLDSQRHPHRPELEEIPSSSWILPQDFPSSPPVFSESSLPMMPHHHEQIIDLQVDLAAHKKLSERTRASMALFAKPQDQIKLQDSIQEQQYSDDSSFISSFSNTLPPAQEQVTSFSLQDRTRQSMSFHPKQQIPKQTRKSLRKSQLFPINQFDSLNRRQTSTLISEDKDDSSEASTPRNRLFEEEADYASVFKSRPRIALSPVLSPVRTNIELEDDLVKDVDDLHLSESHL